MAAVQRRNAVKGVADKRRIRRVTNPCADSIMTAIKRRVLKLVKKPMLFVEIEQSLSDPLFPLAVAVCQLVNDGKMKYNAGKRTYEVRKTSH